MKKLYRVDTISIFRNTYIIDADKKEHALDEVTMIDSGNSYDSFEPAEQIFLDELIVGSGKISEEQFNKLLKKMEKKQSGSYWMGEKLIRKIDYEDKE